MNKFRELNSYARFSLSIIEGLKSLTQIADVTKEKATNTYLVNGLAITDRDVVEFLENFSCVIFEQSVVWTG